MQLFDARWEFPSSTTFARARRALKILATAALGSSTLPAGTEEQQQRKSSGDGESERVKQRGREEETGVGERERETRKVPQDARAPEGDSRELGFIA